MFFYYSQNNSGGKFISNDRVGEYVIIEADDYQEANEIAERVGIYFCGCDDGSDCSCCGDRWSRAYGDGNVEPSVYGAPIEELYKNMRFSPINSEENIHIYYKNGRHEVKNYKVEKLYQEQKKQKQKEAEKIWGVNFNGYGLGSKTPKRYYYSENLNKFYDKSGNCSVKQEGFFTEEDYRYGYFASKNKNDVEKFIKDYNEKREAIVNIVNALNPIEEIEKFAVDAIKQLVK